MFKPTGRRTVTRTQRTRICGRLLGCAKYKQTERGIPYSTGIVSSRESDVVQTRRTAGLHLQFERYKLSGRRLRVFTFQLYFKSAQIRHGYRHIAGESARAAYEDANRNGRCSRYQYLGRIEDQSKVGRWRGESAERDAEDIRVRH